MSDPIFLVTWFDSCFEERLDVNQPFRDVPVMTTVGYLIRDDEQVLTLAMTQGFGGWDEVLHIPRTLVVSCREVRTDWTGDAPLPGKEERDG